jgi:hypothetical protein
MPIHGYRSFERGSKPLRPRYALGLVLIHHGAAFKLPSQLAVLQSQHLAPREFTMKPTDSLLKALIAAHGIIHCHAAITWQAISCTGVTVDGASIDDIWDNTRALAQNAISQIDSLINAPRLVPKVGDVSRIGFNAQAMWNINVQTKFWKSLPSSDQAILRRAQSTSFGNLSLSM